MTSYMSIDGIGYVHYHADESDAQGVIVEHYSGSLIEDPRKQAEALEEVREHCDQLIELEIPVTLNNVCFYFEWYRTLERNDPYAHLLTHVNCMVERGDTDWALFFEDDGGNATVLINEGGMLHEEVDDSRDFDPNEKQWGYHEFKARGWNLAAMGQGAKLGVCYANKDQVIAWFKAKGITPNTLLGHGNWVD